MPFLSGSHLCVRMGYTLPPSIKEEKKDEEGVGISKSEKRESWETESEEETREEVQRVFFHFLSKALSRENTVIGEWGFLSCKIGRESIERVSATWRACFHLGRERLEYRWAAVAFLSSLYVYVLLCTRIA